jgi:DNA-binding NarL/FixJ family response regulator
VLIVDDHEEFRDGLDALVRSGVGVTVVGHASTGGDAIARARSVQPDVILMDLKMPDVSGFEATRAIVTTSPHIRILVLTMSDDEESIFSALRAGARGYLLKGSGREEILRAIRAVAAGEAIFGSGVTPRIVSFLTDPHFAGGPPELAGLSSREREILDLMAAGHNNTSIAGELFINQKTVRNYITNIFSKLQVADRSEAIVRARNAGLGRGLNSYAVGRS